MTMDLQTFRQFGPYILLKRLGMGGMAELYLALRQGPLGVRKLVALKCILSSFNAEADYIRLFYHEARLGLRLQHPNVMATWDCCPIEGRHVMAMEFLHGTTVQEILEFTRQNQIRVPVEVAVEIAIQALDGLQYLHTLTDERNVPLNIVHRDVSPHNIFVCYDGLCKIFDFGVARFGDPQTDIQHGMIVGKVAYMSPEQCHGLDLDGRSDTFALAAVLYELATGIPVFLRDNDIKTLNAVTTDPIVPPTKIDRNFPVFLSRIIMQGLERDINRRFTCADEFSNELRTFLKVAGYGRSRQALKDFLVSCFGTEIDRFKADLADTFKIIDENYPSQSLSDLIVESKMAERSGSQELMPVSGNTHLSRLENDQNLAVSQSVLIGVPMAGMVASQAATPQVGRNSHTGVESQGENRVKKWIFGGRR